MPCDLTFVLEGEEEVGSKSLAGFLQKHRAELKCDAVVISDTGIPDRDLPCLTYALRGIAALEVTLHGPSRDLHSGIFGGSVQNPAIALCRLLAKVHDDRGRIAVPGFYDDIAPLTAYERKQMGRIPFRADAFRKILGVPKLFGEHGYTPNEQRSARPTFEVNGLTSGYQSEGSKTIVPAWAWAKITIRLVADQSPAKVTKAVERFLRQHCSATCRMEIRGGRVPRRARGRRQAAAGSDQRNAHRVGDCRHQYRRGHRAAVGGCLVAGDDQRIGPPRLGLAGVLHGGDGGDHLAAVGVGGGDDPVPLAHRRVDHRHPLVERHPGVFPGPGEVEGDVGGERAAGEGTRRAHRGAGLGRREHPGGQDAEATRLAHRGDQLRHRDPAHAGEQNWSLDAEQLGDPRLHGCPPRARGVYQLGCAPSARLRRDEKVETATEPLSLPSFDDVMRAAERIRPWAHRTPVLTCVGLNRMAGARLFFKCENLQKAGAFKFRGATNAVFALDEEAARRGVATHSSGNHAAALALAASLTP